ncbi:MAG: PIN domain-containing protein [Bacteroidetes bacterium]|nr:MAG: PIN domain-containing protein [Bacteroidota bacterium]
MNIYLDTSSIVKLYSNEKESKDLQLLIEGKVIYIGEIGILEFHSAIWKKVRTKSIEKLDAIDIVDSFTNDLSAFKIINIDKSIFGRAIFLIDKYAVEGLRTLDSLQISSALSNTDINEIISFDHLFNKIVYLESKK